MAGLLENPQWEDEIYQIETTDPVVGGPPDLGQGQGITNVPHQLLANRTAYLKARVDEMGVALGGKSDADHGHSIPDVSGLQGALDGKSDDGHTHGWNEISGKPAEFTPSDHGHSIPDVSGLQGALDGKSDDGHTHGWSEISGKPAEFPPEDHTHGWNEISGKPSEFTPSDHGHSISDVSGLQSSLGQNAPPGLIGHFAKNSAPPGWLKANGAEISRTVYSDLFNAIGTTFGAGNGVSTFNLPDLRGEFVRAWDDGRGVDENRIFGSAQGDAIRNITGRFQGGDDFDNDFEEGAIRVVSQAGTEAGGTSYQDVYEFDASRQVPTAPENRPRNIALLACIKF